MFEWIDSYSKPGEIDESNSPGDASAYHLSSSPPSSVEILTESMSSSPASSSQLQRRPSGLKYWFHHLDTRSSNESSSLGGAAPNLEKASDVADLIVRCLQKCGESTSCLPLFKMIFASLSDIDENRYTRQLDARARDILLAATIARLVQFVSKHIGLVFICDDVQCELYFPSK